MPGSSYVDTWIYETAAAAEAANADAANLAAFSAFFSVLADVAIEVTEFPESAASPLS